MYVPGHHSDNRRITEVSAESQRTSSRNSANRSSLFSPRSFPSCCNDERTERAEAWACLLAHTLMDWLLRWFKAEFTLLEEHRTAFSPTVTHPGERTGLTLKGRISFSVYKTQFHKSIQDLGIPLKEFKVVPENFIFKEKQKS